MRERTEEEYKKMIKRYEQLIDEEPSEVYKKLMNQGLRHGYIKNVLCAMKWKTKNEEYGEIIGAITDELQKKEKFKNKFGKIDWRQIPKPQGGTIDDVIIGLYTMFPPRRIIDYSNMIYSDKVGEEEENYYVKGKFIFRNYKTVGKYGEQTFEVSKELKNLIKKYVNENGIKSGDALLKYREGGLRFSKQALMRRIMKIFKTSVDGLRHSYITYIYNDKNKLFDIQKTSDMMAHDVKTHIGYLDRDNKYF
jgi:hypothetical protein